LTADDKARLTPSWPRALNSLACTNTSPHFADLMTKRRGHHQEQWITAATASGPPELRFFITACAATKTLWSPD
jgi:hypothetical protein